MPNCMWDMGLDAQKSGKRRRRGLFLISLATCQTPLIFMEAFASLSSSSPPPLSLEKSADFRFTNIETFPQAIRLLHTHTNIQLGPLICVSLLIIHEAIIIVVFKCGTTWVNCLWVCESRTQEGFDTAGWLWRALLAHSNLCSICSWGKRER